MITGLLGANDMFAGHGFPIEDCIILFRPSKLLKLIRYLDVDIVLI